MLLSQSGYCPGLSFTSHQIMRPPPKKKTKKTKKLCVQLTGEKVYHFTDRKDKIWATQLFTVSCDTPTTTAEKQTTPMRVNTPARASVMSSMVGCGLFLSRAYVDITIPGVQKPHWEPWALAIRSWKDITTHQTVYLVFVVLPPPPTRFTVCLH